jgi:hypothetical protein
VRAGPSHYQSWIRRRGAAAAWGLALTVLVSGCGFVTALAHPAADSAPSPPATAGSGTTTSPSSAPVPVAAADLVASSHGRPASLAVAVSPPHPGVPPFQTLNGPLTDDCHLSADAVEYETLTIGFTDHGPADTKQDDEAPNLRVDVTAPAGSGVGVFVEDADGIYCQGAPTMPAQATLQTQDLAGEHQTFTVYLVARTRPAAPDPLHGVSVQLGNLRRNPDVINPRPWTWNVQRVTTGSACPGEPESLCVPLS